MGMIQRVEGRADNKERGRIGRGVGNNLNIRHADVVVDDVDKMLVCDVPTSNTNTQAQEINQTNNQNTTTALVNIARNNNHTKYQG